MIINETNQEFLDDCDVKSKALVQMVYDMFPEETELNQPLDILAVISIWHPDYNKNLFLFVRTRFMEGEEEPMVLMELKSRLEKDVYEITNNINIILN